MIEFNNANYWIAADPMQVQTDPEISANIHDRLMPRVSDHLCKKHGER